MKIKQFIFIISSFQRSINNRLLFPNGLGRRSCLCSRYPFMEFSYSDIKRWTYGAVNMEIFTTHVNIGTDGIIFKGKLVVFFNLMLENIH